MMIPAVAASAQDFFQIGLTGRPISTTGGRFGACGLLLGALCCCCSRLTFLSISVFNAGIAGGAALSEMAWPQALHLVDVTPGGILPALMLYFLLQYKQVISLLPVSGCAVFVASGFGGSVDRGFNEIVWPQALHFVLVTPAGRAFGLILYFLLQYRQVICMTAGLGAPGRKDMEFPQALHWVLVTPDGILL